MKSVNITLRTGLSEKPGGGGKMFFNAKLIRVIAVLTAALLLGSCYFRINHYRPRPVDKAQTAEYKGRVLLLIWENEAEPRRLMYLAGVTLSDSLLCGTVKALDPMRLTKRSVLADVYLDASVPQPASVPQNLAIPLSGINRVEVYRYHWSKNMLRIGLNLVLTFVTIAALDFLLSATGIEGE